MGSSAQFNCTSDLNILVAEWLFEGQVVVEAEASQATLIIPAVNAQQTLCVQDYNTLWYTREKHDHYSYRYEQNCQKKPTT